MLRREQRWTENWAGEGEKVECNEEELIQSTEEEEYGLESCEISIYPIKASTI